MTCKYCKDDNKIVRTIAWAVYLAPLAYSAYILLKEMGVVDKARDVVEPYVETGTEKASEVYETVKDKVNDTYDKLTDVIVEVADKTKDSKVVDGKKK